MKEPSAPHLMASIPVTSSFCQKRVGAVHWNGKKSSVDSTLTKEHLEGRKVGRHRVLLELGHKST